MRDQQLVDALAADDPEILAVAVSQDAFQLVQIVADDGVLRAEGPVAGQDDILPVPEGTAAREGLQSLAAVDDGLVDGQLAEALEVRGDGHQQLAVLSDAPLGGDVYDRVHFFSYFQLLENIDHTITKMGCFFHHCNIMFADIICQHNLDFPFL